jgi:phytoene/squalene synthetase
MTIAACADLVRRGDPDRFLAVMAAPPAQRGPLFVLFAANLEVARAPFASEQPMIAEMRLQWWRDTVAPGAPRRAHEVAGPLHDLLAGGAVDRGTLDRLMDARRWDCWAEPHEDLPAYLEATGGGLLRLAAQTTGGDVDRAGPAGWAMALAAYLVAVPALAAAGKQPLPPGVDLAGLADDGLARLTRARGRDAALFPAFLAGPILRQVRRRPGDVAAGALGLSEFRKRARLIRLSMTGF